LLPLPAFSLSSLGGKGLGGQRPFLIKGFQPRQKSRGFLVGKEVRRMGKERQSSVSAVDKRLDEASSGADFLSLNKVLSIQEERKDKKDSWGLGRVFQSY